MKNQRAEISKKNKYWIPKYRYLELKNYCLQYPDWKLALKELSLLQSHTVIVPGKSISDPTNQMAVCRLRYEENIKTVEEIAALSDPTLAKWIIKGVTENLSYDYLRYQLEIPAGRDMYYDRYRRFFWLLDQRKK